MHESYTHQPTPNDSGRRRRAPTCTVDDVFDLLDELVERPRDEKRAAASPSGRPKDPARAGSLRHLCFASRLKRRARLAP